MFNQAMTDWTTRLVDAVIDAYAFSPFGTIVDVGGSYRTLLAAVLRSNQTASGILFDQPHAATAAKAHLVSAGVAERCQIVGGDFFLEVPTGGDAYLLAQIRHDWDDERSTTILRQCRGAMLVDGKRLMIELVLPLGEEPFFGKWRPWAVGIGRAERLFEEAPIKAPPQLRQRMGRTQLSSNEDSSPGLLQGPSGQSVEVCA